MQPVNSEPPRLDRRIFRAFLASARAAIAAELATRKPGAASAADLARKVQRELLDLLAARAGRPQPRTSALGEQLRTSLAARLAAMELPFDFLGTAHLDYVSSTISLAGGRPQVARNVSRKASGAYYTPEHIARRIVAETLEPRLARAQSLSEAAALRIADVACGSGVFLLEAARALRRFYTGLGLAADEATAIAAGQLTGADLSPEAIDVARLAFDVARAGEPRLVVADSLSLGHPHGDTQPTHDPLAPGTFDIVIGNPPYNAISRLDASARRRLGNDFEVFAGHGDLHYCFFERGLQLLKPGGLLGLLSSAYYLQASHALKLRRMLAARTEIARIIDCSAADLFPDAMIHCVITILRKSAPGAGSALVYEPASGPPFEFPQRELSGAPWVIVNDAERQWRTRIESNSVPLGEICRILQGPESGLNEAFSLPAAAARSAGIEPALLRQLIKNSDIGRYAIAYSDQVMLYVPRGTPMEDFPAALRHLERFRRKLEAREVCRTTGAPWYELHRPREAAALNAPGKIVCPYRAEGNRFAIDTRRALNDGGDVRMILPGPYGRADLHFIAALLNSRMMERYFRQIGRPKGKLLEYFKDSLARLPVRLPGPGHPLAAALGDLSRRQHERFSEQIDYLVERMVLDLYEMKSSPVFGLLA